MNTRINIWELDAVKGAAMLAVLVIHGEPLVGTWAHEHVINRAVPVLLILFGATSELWWRRRSAQPLLQTAREFWSARFRRLLPPVWAALLIWWLVKLVFEPANVPRWTWIPAHLVGYMPQVGTGWFVTLIMQLVLLFPLLRAACDRIGIGWCAVLSFGILCWSQLEALQVVDLMRLLMWNSAPVSGFFVFYYLWIFAPARFFSLYAGVQLTRWNLRVPLYASAAAVATVVAGAAIQDQLLVNNYAKNALGALLDIPLTIGLLALAGLVRPAPLRASLCWLGRESWGIYLGQLVIHSTCYDRLDFGGSLQLRWLYCCALLVGGVLWVYAGQLIGTLASKRRSLTAPNRLDAGSTARLTAAGRGATAESFER